MPTVTKKSTPVPIMSTKAPQGDQSFDRVAEALFGRTRLRVLSLLYGQPEKSFYLREIARSTMAGLGAVQRELARLVMAGLILRNPQGQHVYFAANRASPVFSELRGLLEKTGGIQAAVRAELRKLSRQGLVDFAFIYGSVASRKQGFGSDIDIMVIGPVSLARLLSPLRRLEVQLGREVNPSVFATHDFARKYASRDHFIRRVMEKPKVMLVGAEDDLRDLVAESMADRARKQR